MRLAAWAAVQTVLALGLGVVLPVTEPVPRHELQLRYGLTVATGIVAIAGHIVRALHGVR
jgi:hypothetical protein